MQSSEGLFGILFIEMVGYFVFFFCVQETLANMMRPVARLVVKWKAFEVTSCIPLYGESAA